MRPKQWTDEDLIAAVIKSTTYREVVINLGLSPNSNRTKDRIRYRCDELNLDRSHFGAVRYPVRRYRTDEELFVEGEQYSVTIRKRFLGTTDYECSICGISEWCGNSLTLQVDHIDGNTFNNKLDNLRLLCPNCHTQTTTWGVPKSKE